jgi:uncharacterized protein
MEQAATPDMPVAPAERITAIDALRGFAILGILIMNIQSFSMISAAYINPTAFGDLSGLNRWVWMLSHIFADEKFMTIFAMLFGAGILILTGRIEAGGHNPKPVHFRRNLWLIVIGLLHAYLLWMGDILVSYGVSALIAYAGRKAPVRKLLTAGIIILAVPSLLGIMFGSSMQFWPPDAVENTMRSWLPSQEAVDTELAAYRGAWLDQMTQRVPTAVMMQTFIFLIRQGWRALGLMLLGMVAYRRGLLSAALSTGSYLKLMLLGFGVGLPLIAVGVVRNFAAGWSIYYSMFIGDQFNYWGSLGVSLGYISLVMLACKANALSRLVKALASVGRMALTNYLVQTFVFTFIFYGHGLGLFGRVERTGQILMVFGMWAVQIAISPVYMRYFRFGPFEWLWRSLTYMRRQPMRL